MSVTLLEPSAVITLGRGLDKADMEPSRKVLALLEHHQASLESVGLRSVRALAKGEGGMDSEEEIRSAWDIIRYVQPRAPPSKELKALAERVEEKGAEVQVLIGGQAKKIEQGLRDGTFIKSFILMTQLQDAVQDYVIESAIGYRGRFPQKNIVSKEVYVLALSAAAGVLENHRFLVECLMEEVGKVMPYTVNFRPVQDNPHVLWARRQGAETVKKVWRTKPEEILQFGVSLMKIPFYPSDSGAAASLGAGGQQLGLLEKVEELKRHVIWGVLNRNQRGGPVVLRFVQRPVHRRWLVAVDLNLLSTGVAPELIQAWLPVVEEEERQMVHVRIIPKPSVDSSSSNSSNSSSSSSGAAEASPQKESKKDRKGEQQPMIVEDELISDEEMEERRSDEELREIAERSLAAEGKIGELRAQIGCEKKGLAELKLQRQRRLQRMKEVRKEAATAKKREFKEE